MIRLLVAEAHAMLRQGLLAVFADPGIADDAEAVDVVADVTTMGDARRHIKSGDLDVVLVDEQLPGGDVLGFVRSLARHHQAVRAVVLSGDPSDARMMAFLRGGAAGYVAQSSHPSVVYHAVLAAATGGTYIDPGLAGRLVTLAARGSRVRGPHGLTVQQIRVLGLLGDDLTNREIGERLGISHETVKTHLAHALSKIGARDRIQGAEIVRRDGIGWGRSGTHRNSEPSSPA